ncbi:MAG: type II secretion system protein [Candidatus Paceibacterota bacterium]
MSRTNHISIQAQKKGMTLVETLVAIAILLVVTTAVMSTAQGSLRATYSSRDQITAYYLAQEANEYVRNTRDSNTLSETNEWDTYLVGCIDAPCTVDTSKTPDDGGLEVCTGPCESLKYDPVSSQYGYWDEFGSESQFTRYVLLEPLGGNGDEMRVTTTVEWSVGVRERKIVVESLVFNWN